MTRAISFGCSVLGAYLMVIAFRSPLSLDSVAIGLGGLVLSGLVFTEMRITK